MMKEIPEQAASLHMHSVILWTNGVCMVFDDQGQQMPEFQGLFEVKAPLINAVFRGSWEYGDWNRGIISATPLRGQYRPTIEIRVDGILVLRTDQDE